MKYIQNKLDFHQNEVINEELLGGLFKKLFSNAKSKIAIAISKNIGNIGDINKMLSQYKSSLLKIMQPKIDVLKEITEMELSIDNGGEGSLDELKQLVLKYKKVVTNVDAQVLNNKTKFDVQVAQVVKKESNTDVKDYIALKKYDMAQEFLQMELNLINNGSGLSTEQIEKSATLKKINNDLMNIAKQVAKAKEKAEGQVSSSNSDDTTGVQSATPNEFDEEKATTDGNYSWNSQFSNGEYVFDPGEAIKYWSNSQKEAKDAFVVDQNKAKLTKKVKEGQIVINTVKGEVDGSFIISTGKVVSTKKADDAKDKNDAAKSDAANDENNNEDADGNDSKL
jgi:hypothetical protein